MKNSVLVLGRMFPEEAEKEIVSHSRGMVSSAASAHLEKIIKGLDFSFGGEVSVLNVPPVSSYPRWYDRLFVPEYEYSHDGTANDISIGFFNLVGVKNISVRHRLNKYAADWARSNDADNKYVVVYTMNEIFLKTCKKIKSICPECHICVVVPDLPAYTDLDKSGFLYKMIISRRVKKTNALSEIADSFVFLTKQMADYFPVKRPYIVSEGIADIKAAPQNGEKKSNQDIVTVAYTGSFTKKYGITDLIDAIDGIKSPYIRFVICGSGEAYAEIEEKAKNDSRIIFRGMVTHEESLKIQREADILINPRSNDGEYTKYSFPSKIMEYMTAGKPVMCFKLDGIPDEYDKYLTYFDSKETMAQQIEKMCAMSSERLARIGKDGAEFVTREKSCEKFGENIRTLLQKKRLLICCDDLEIGGTTTSLLSLLNMLDTDKYSVDLITPKNNGQLMCKIPEYVNVLPQACGMSDTKRRLLYLVKGYAVRRIIYKKFKAEKYPKGLFQLMSGKAYSSVSRRLNRYYDVSVGYMEGFPTNYVIDNTISGKKIVYVHVNYKSSGLDPSMDRKLFEKADRIAVVSDDSKAAMREIFPDFADKLYVAENPISPQLIRKMADEPIPENDYAPKEYFNIITAARLSNAHKAIDRAVLAMAKLKSHTNIRWYVFGDGEDRVQIERLIAENHLENSFILMGERNNVYPYIKKADLFVLPSRYEGKPMSVTEAQILGCVPLVTRYGSAHEQIRDMFDGFICENTDEDELARAVEYAADNPKVMYEMRRRLSKGEYACGLDGFYKLLDM